MKLGQSLSALIKKPADGKTADEKSDKSFKELLARYNESERKGAPRETSGSQNKALANPGMLLIIRFSLAVVLLLIAAFVEMPAASKLAVQIIATAIIGYDTVISAISDIREQYFSCESLPVLVAVIISFGLGLATEAVVALILVRIAFFVRSYAILRVQSALGSEHDFFPDCEFSSDPLEFSEGETAPFDSVVQKGICTVDLSFITGDRSATTLRTGDFLPAGSRCLGGHALVEPVSSPDESISARMSGVIRSGSSVVTQAEEKLRSVSNYFALCVLAFGILIMALVPILSEQGFAEGLRRAITIFAIASPGASILAVPFAYYASMVAGRSQGALFKSAAALEKMSRMRSVVFEKKGTLTGQDFIVSDIKTDKMDSATFLKVAAYAQASVDNPVARAIKTAYGEEISGELVQDFVEHRGRGVSVSVDGIGILLGDESFLEENSVDIPRLQEKGYAVHMSVNGIYAGRIILNENLNPTAPAIMEKLCAVGIERIAMISSDSRERDAVVAGGLGIDEYVAECKPEDKARRIKEMKARIDSKSTLAYVTDGAGETDLSEAADLTFTLNGLKQPDRLNVADVTFMGTKLDAIADVAVIAFAARRRVMILVAVALFSKLVIAVLAALGLAPLWFGVLLDACTSLALLIDSLSPRRLA